jgi:hypothetical protein
MNHKHSAVAPIRMADKRVYLSTGSVCDQHNKRISGVDMKPNQIAAEDSQPTIEYAICTHCNGDGTISTPESRGKFQVICPLCDGHTAFGVDPLETKAYPGTRAKIAVLAARYAKGHPMHCEHDINVGNLALTELLQLT